MKFLIISHVSHGFDRKYFGYAPYIREMNIWNKFADKVVVVAPFQAATKSTIDLEYDHQNLVFKRIDSINFQSFGTIFKSLLKIPTIFWIICKEMKSADHIHLRCPGNFGLLGCIAQIFFPSKEKSAKYAGNWDPNSTQPISYKLQKWILSNTFLTRNIQVLVYGEWPNQTKNIKSFFTASYFEKDKIEIQPKHFGRQIQFLFVGTLSEGKRPMYAVRIVEQLQKMGNDVCLNIYGNGSMENEIQTYIQENYLQEFIFLKGNCEEYKVRKAYQEAHFLILASKSEGWPKVVTEAMFWKCIPIATKVSCISSMLQNGQRGIMLSLNLREDVQIIQYYIENEQLYQMKVVEAMDWSRKFTLDLFEIEIKTILNR